MQQLDRRIELFGRIGCSDCAASKAQLAQQRVSYVYKDIETTPEVLEEYNRIVGDGPRKTPYIVFLAGTDGNHMEEVGRLIEPKAHELTQMLQQTGYIK